MADAAADKAEDGAEDKAEDGALDDAVMARGRRILAAQPFSAAMGAELVDFTPGKVVIRLPMRADLKQHMGFAHGGAIAYMADCALTFAGGSVLGDCLTAEFKINFMRPGQGVALVAEGAVLSAGKASAITRCEIWDEAEDGTRKLCAAAQGTIRKV
ncbi:PaaI family thioesterase [Rhodovulum sp. DZ06]|uniref:PaaI family thioesterase n=1 Tax=Rhodovulum sp. DZ06 TaxID=3425126 RepID=UPI003D345006